MELGMAKATAREKVMAKEMLDPSVVAFHFERRQKAVGRRQRATR
jgi:hypothetical protein